MVEIIVSRLASSSYIDIDLTDALRGICSLSEAPGCGLIKSSESRTGLWTLTKLPSDVRARTVLQAPFAAVGVEANATAFRSSPVTRVDILRLIAAELPSG